MVRLKDTFKAILLHHFNLGDSCTKTLKVLQQTYGEDAPSYSCIKKWFKRFKSGDISLKDATVPGRPQEVSDEILLKKIEENPDFCSESLSQMMNCCQRTIERHLKRLGFRYKLGQWVPHELTVNNKRTRKSKCELLIEKNEKQPFLRYLVTSDEKWILFDNVKNNRRWLRPTDQNRQVAKPKLTPKKVMLCVWWDCQGVIHWELLNNGQTVTAEVYIQQLTRVQEQLIKKRPALINFKRVTFLHDNARPHTAKITQEFLDKLGWDVLSHPPYSPDIAPSDYHLFRSLEHFIRNKKYTSKEEVKNALTSFFDSKLRPFYAKGINKLPDRWQKIIDANGNYAFN